jgi:hypothetical protein
MFKRVKKKLNNFSYPSAQFFLAAVTAQRDEVDERILLGDNTGGGAAMLWPIKRQSEVKLLDVRGFVHHGRCQAHCA